MAVQSSSPGARERANDLAGASPAASPPKDARAARYIDRTDYERRHFVNLAAAAMLLAIAIAVVWTLRAIDEQERIQRCLYSGRQDCIDLGIAHPRRQGPRQILR